MFERNDKLKQSTALDLKDIDSHGAPVYTGVPNRGKNMLVNFRHGRDILFVFRCCRVFGKQTQIRQANWAEKRVQSSEPQDMMSPPRVETRFGKEFESIWFPPSSPLSLSNANAGGSTRQRPVRAHPKPTSYLGNRFAKPSMVR